jgi:glycerophosphoryl diester phosphodiesterase
VSLTTAVRSEADASPGARTMPELIAHRGAAHDAPENTVAAFELAWQQGADGIEGDFRLTCDGEIVCLHDADTRRTAGRALKVADASLAELRRLDVGWWKGEAWRGARIPTLAEVLATVPPGKKLVIEIKCGPEILPGLQAALAGSGLLPAQIVVVAFDFRVVAAAKQQLPRLKALWLKALSLTDFRTASEAGVHPSAEEIVKTLARTGADGVGCRAHAAVDQAFVQTLRRAHKEVHIWTVDDVKTAQRYLTLGVDSITSNRAGWLKQQLRGEPDNG